MSDNQTETKPVSIEIEQCEAASKECIENLRKLKALLRQLAEQEEESSS
jgi:hypothetical protein